VKRRRRLEIRVERHELSIYSGSAHSGSARTPAQTSSPAHPPAANRVIAAQLNPGGIQPDLPVQPEPCPICGAQRRLPLADAIAAATLTSNALKDGLEAGCFHLHCSRSGEWWLCSQSPHAS